MSPRAKTLLVANRGEIAIRIFRTAARMGLRTVAVYSDADADAPHVRAADTSRRIGPSPATDSYLRRERIIDAARDTGAALIHPGYGFLAEDDRFAKDCEDLGYTFVGPPSAVLRQVGDKSAARALAIEAGVPVLPGYAGDDQSNEALASAAEMIGYPVLVKPSGGGGGKGMAVVGEASALQLALDSARRVARSAFDDDRLILERYVESPRHVEVQIVADSYGTVVHLGERDCSLQRRHQKILEESPAPNLSDDVRAALHAAAVAFARAASYVGAGTCEFLVAPDGTFGFMEMNARLQVEHPVTEMVTGLDLVELQLDIAMGGKLAVRPEDVRPRGHAIEVRVYAEDPATDFLPQAGRIEHVRWPDGVRIDSGIEEGTDVPPHYDPLLAKVIVAGDDRAGALAALHRALSRAEILGPRTNLTFLTAVGHDRVVLDGSVTTDWLERAYGDWRHDAALQDRELAIAVAAAAEADRILSSSHGTDPWTTLGAWRAGLPGAVRVVLRDDDIENVAVVEGHGPFTVDGRRRVGRGSGCHEWLVSGSSGTSCAAARTGHGSWLVWAFGAQLEIAVGVSDRRSAATPGRLESPLPGQVIAVRVEAGQKVTGGEELVVVEAMKMEHAIRAPAAGVVRAVLCAAGDQVDRGQSLVDFEPS